jgi:hypothetical protein
LRESERVRVQKAARKYNKIRRYSEGFKGLKCDILVHKDFEASDYMKFSELKWNLKC